MSMARRMWHRPNDLVGKAFLSVTGGEKSWRFLERFEYEAIPGSLGEAILRDKFSVAAISLGKYVFYRPNMATAERRAHEAVHVDQSNTYGPLWFPFYGAASFLAWVGGGHYYRDNHFEREAKR